MIGIDTNILIRALTGDDPDQLPHAVALLRDEILFVPKTVLLEMVWVLRVSYGYDRTAIAGALRKLFALPTLRFEDEAAIARALDWHDEGLGFPDALHLASSGSATEFATFDRRLARRAGRLGLAPPVRLYGG